MLEPVPFESATEQSIDTDTSRKDSEQKPQNCCHGFFEYMRGCYTSCSFSIQNSPSFIRGFLGRGWSLLRNRNTETQGNNGLNLNTDSVSSYPAYMEEPTLSSTDNLEAYIRQPPQIEFGCLTDLETDCDSVPIIDCILEMSDNKSEFSID